MAEQQVPPCATEWPSNHALKRIEMACRERLDNDQRSYFNLGAQRTLALVHALRQARQERDQAVAEVEAIRAELLDQWEENHFEHCGRDWPHPPGKACMWPPPAVLGTPVLDGYDDD